MKTIRRIFVGILAGIFLASVVACTGVGSKKGDGELRCFAEAFEDVDIPVFTSEQAYRNFYGAEELATPGFKYAVPQGTRIQALTVKSKGKTIARVKILDGVHKGEEVFVHTMFVSLD
jgi:hypothetical protein